MLTTTSNVKFPPQVDITKVIMYGLIGSRAYGIATPESDYDYRGIMFGPADAYLGLNGFDQIETKEPDSTIYDVRKYCRLAYACNPNILELLWLPDKFIVYKSYHYEFLRNKRQVFLCQRVRQTYGGYAVAQIKKCRAKLMGEQNVGIKNKLPYKHAGHCYRLLKQCQELLEEGELKVNREGIDADKILAIRKGEVPLEEVLFECEDLLQKMDTVSSDLPKDQNFKAVNEIVMHLLREYLVRDSMTGVIRSV